MKKIIFLICLGISLRAGVIELNNEISHSLISEREDFFSEAFDIVYDKAKTKLDSKGFEFIDLCKYQLSGYKFNCLSINKEQIAGIKKYFIHTENIQKAYKIFNNSNDELPKTNIYDYGETESNIDDGVGNYYIWDNGKIWIIKMGYDGGSITIYQQKSMMVEIIYQWSLEW